MRELENLVKRIVVLESEEFVTRELTGRGSGLGATNGVVGIRAEREKAAATIPAEPPREEDAPRRRTAWTLVLASRTWHVKRPAKRSTG